MDWIHLAKVRVRLRALVKAVMNVRVPQTAVNFFTSWEMASFSRRILLYGVSSPQPPPPLRTTSKQVPLNLQTSGPQFLSISRTSDPILILIGSYRNECYRLVPSGQRRLPLFFHFFMNTVILPFVDVTFLVVKGVLYKLRNKKPCREVLKITV